LQARIHEAAPMVPVSIGLGKVMQRINAEPQSLATRIGNFFSSFAVKPAMAMALLGIVVIQGGVIANLLQGETVEFRAGNATVVTDGPLVKVNFAPDAKESDIRLLLVAVQGTLAGGPGQLGDYYVRVPSGKESQAAAKFKANKI